LPTKHASELSRGEVFVNRQNGVEKFDHISGREFLSPPRFDFSVEPDIAALNQHLRLAAGIGSAAKLQKLIQPKRSGLAFLGLDILCVGVRRIRILSRRIVCHDSPRVLLKRFVRTRNLTKHVP